MGGHWHNFGVHSAIARSYCMLESAGVLVCLRFILPTRFSLKGGLFPTRISNIDDPDYAKSPTATSFRRSYSLKPGDM